MEQVLTRGQVELVALERRLVLHVRDALARADGSRADLERLAALVHQMDELFLLVVVGDLPTTRVISILRYGDPGPPEALSPHLLVYRYPLDVLHDLEIVDTPGTNSIERMEEDITRGFVPRADLVLFVTSLLQPLTASELDFLGHIREWGKKVVFVVNGADRRNSDDQLDRVREYLTREIQARLGGPPPTLYFVSALRALRAKLAAKHAGATDPRSDGAPVAAVASDPRDEYAALERYLLETLRETERIRLKLLSPLGVLRHLLDGNVDTLERRLVVVDEDGRVFRSIREQLAAYTAEMRADSERYQLGVRAVLHEVERRGRAWFERTIRVGNFNLLRNKDAVENRFRAEVVADAARDIEAVVHQMVDWTVRRNLKLWTTVFAELDAHSARLRESGALSSRADTEFLYNREELFARIRVPVERRLEDFHPDQEAQRIVDSVREAMTAALGVNVFALGLGAVLVTAFTTAALDVTGVLAATLFAVAGWLIIPARRRKLMQQFEARIAKLSADLTALLAASFAEQLARYEQQLLEVVQPYERFLETERSKVEAGLAELRQAQRDVAGLEQRVDTTFPEPTAARS